MTWLSAEDNATKLRMWKLLQKDWFAIVTDKKILNENVNVGKIWDVNPRVSASATDLEKLLMLPENEKIKNQLNSSLSLSRSSQ